MPPPTSDHAAPPNNETTMNRKGPRITADSGEWGTFAFSRLLCGVPGMRVAGGTDEVMRNIVAEQVLGLPKGPGVDKNLPFSELRVGTQRDD